MRKHQNDEMPDELDFSGSGRSNRPRLEPGTVAVVLTSSEGGCEELTIDVAPRPDHEAAGPKSVSGVVDEVLYFLYNPDNDCVSMRLLSSFDEAVVLEDEDANGIRALRSKATGYVVGMFVRGYLAHFGARGAIDTSEVEARIRSGLSLFVKALHAA